MTEQTKGSLTHSGVDKIQEKKNDGSIVCRSHFSGQALLRSSDVSRAIEKSQSMLIRNGMYKVEEEDNYWLIACSHLCQQKKR